MPEHSLSAVPACASQAGTQTGLRRRQAMADRQAKKYCKKRDNFKTPSRRGGFFSKRKNLELKLKDRDAPVL